VCLLEYTHAQTHFVAAPQLGAAWCIPLDVGREVAPDSGLRTGPGSGAGPAPLPPLHGAGHVVDRGPGLCQPAIWIGSAPGSASNHLMTYSRLPAPAARPLWTQALLSVAVGHAAVGVCKPPCPRLCSLHSGRSDRRGGGRVFWRGVASEKIARTQCVFRSGRGRPGRSRAGRSGRGRG
jgi:hypothetical protein